MNFAKSMLAARTSILQQGIQQTNRYVFKESNSDPEYPYSVVLPGYGYDLIDHSIWSIIRKIPFRKTYTELQVTFIVGSDNYSRYINKWQSAISKPVRSNGGVSSAANFAQLNGKFVRILEEDDSHWYLVKTIFYVGIQSKHT